jgi:MHS family proline/betaine transporter-like MFS transporter
MEIGQSAKIKMSLIKKYSSKLPFAVTATIFGNMLQWFDFSLFGMMFPVFIKVFFPTWNISLFFAFFAIGAFARPIGGLFFGYVGDTAGRRTALIRTILLMTAPILIVAFLPSYEEIGSLAGFILIFLYLFQGFCVGGEFPGSIVFLEETAPLGKRSYIGSLSYFGVILGMFLVSVDTYELSHRLSPEQIKSWGWRLPFYMAALIGTIGAIMRFFLHETPIFQQAKNVGHLVKKPITDTLKKHKKNLVQGIGIYILDAIGFNIILIFSSYYYFEYLHLSVVRSFQINLISIFFLLILIPVMGKVGDRVGSVRLAKWAATGMFLFAYPLYLLINLNTPLSIFIGQFSLLFILGSFVCNMPKILFELFSTEVRYTCVGIAINFSVAIFGCSAPFINQSLIQKFNPSMPGIFLTAAALIAFFSLHSLSSAKK